MPTIPQIIKVTHSPFGYDALGVSNISWCPLSDEEEDEGASLQTKMLSRWDTSNKEGSIGAPKMPIRPPASSTRVACRSISAASTEQDSDDERELLRFPRVEKHCRPVEDDRWLVVPKVILVPTMCIAGPGGWKSLTGTSRVHPRTNSFPPARIKGGYSEEVFSAANKHARHRGINTSSHCRFREVDGGGAGKYAPKSIDEQDLHFHPESIGNHIFDQCPSPPAA
jgi:hypothetical protein